jgi:hypothetical protein
MVIAIASVLALCALAAIPAVLAAVQDNEKVDLCHRSSSASNPYQSISVPIDNKDGTINGHETHTGPVFPAPNWGDIIPPYTWTDRDGVKHAFDGYNMSDDGTAIWQNGCNPKTPVPPTNPTQIAVVKSLIPSDDPGTFDLKVGEDTVATGVGDAGHGEKEVEPGTPYTVSESGAGETDLADYSIESRCTMGNKDVGTSHGASVSGVTVPEGETVTCTFTNTAKLPPDSESVTPELDCVLFKDGQPDVAYWGYENKNGHIVPIPIGPQNTFEPASANGNQPTEFLDGHHVGAFTTEFDASSGNLVWHLTGAEATASANSPPCGATIELRKVTVPSNDPGVFNLLINNTVVASGGNGTTTGHLQIGTGEGTVRETAEPGTDLADYNSKVECTRNGTVAVAVPGTKVDGAIAQGDTVVCTFTNTRKGTPPQPPTPTPTPPPTPPDPNPPPVPPTPPGPAPQLDLVVTKSVQPETVVVGGRLTWTMTVTNRSSVAAADVNGLKVDDPRSFRTRLISLRASQGTCRPYTCDLGRLAPGASAKVTAVTEATRVGVVVDIVRISSEETESNYRNNVAAAIARVVGRLTPPVGQNRCDTLTVAPRVLQAGRSSVVLLTALNRQGQPLAGVRVRVRGPGVDRTVRTDRQGTVRRTVLPTQVGLVFFSGSPRTLSPRHCRTLLAVAQAKGTVVTG